MRKQVSWLIGKDQIFATLDIPQDRNSQSALLIVSGGNEIRSGSHNSQSQLAHYMCNQGHYVLRFDRRGTGDSEGENAGYINSGDDIFSAAQYLRTRLGAGVKVSAFGNCDAASALLLNLDKLNLSSLILANPWTYDPDPKDDQETGEEDSKTSTPSAAAIRARYWARIKNPRSIIDLFSGKIDLTKLVKGLMNASKKEDLSDLAHKMNLILSDTHMPVDILIAEKDSTAMAFMEAYKSKDFTQVRDNPNVNISSTNSASHSFADKASKSWFYEKLSSLLS